MSPLESSSPPDSSTISAGSQEQAVQTTQDTTAQEKSSSNFAGRAFGQIGNVVTSSPVWVGAIILVLLVFLTLLWLHYKKM